MLDFYDNLSSNGVFIFWIVVCLFAILLVLLVVLLFKNRKLNHLISNMVTEEYKDDDIIVNNKVAVKSEIKVEKPIINEEIEKKEIKPIVVEEKKEEVKPVVVEEKIEVFNPVIEEKKEAIKPTIVEKPIIEEKRIEERPPVRQTSAYQKNVLREMSKRMPISPIGIVKDESSVKEENVNLNMHEDMVSPLENMEDNYNVSDNMKFASDIVEQMEKEIKPSNIELTDYEKKQEEEAIISYDELVKVKDKIYNITEEEENDDFIDELKNFRLDLQ